MVGPLFRGPLSGLGRSGGRGLFLYRGRAARANAMDKAKTHRYQ